jgi:hypothetical protein
MSVEAMQARKWVALGATLVVMAAGAVTSGNDLTRCEQAYLASGVGEQRMSSEEFGELYSDSVCATSGPSK